MIFTQYIGMKVLVSMETKWVIKLECIKLGNTTEKQDGSNSIILSNGETVITMLW
jgi:hypothetical protein